MKRRLGKLCLQDLRHCAHQTASDIVVQAQTDALVMCLCRGDMTLGIPPLCIERLCVLQKTFAGKGGQCPGPAPVEQSCAEQFFEGADAMGDRGLGNAQSLGRLIEASRLHQISECLEQLNIQTPDSAAKNGCFSLIEFID